MGDALSGWSADPDWTTRAAAERAKWDAHVDSLRAGIAPDGSLTYAQVVGVVNDASGPDDYVLGSSRAQTHPDGLVTALLGDGSYLMLNSELFQAAFAVHPFVAVVCDNGGYALIHRLQTNQRADGFNNLLTDCAGPGAKPGGVRVDFALHAQALGCAVVSCRTHPSSWTESGACWEVGVPAGLSGHAAYPETKAKHLRWTS